MVWSHVNAKTRLPLISLTTSYQLNMKNHYDHTTPTTKKHNNFIFYQFYQSQVMYQSLQPLSINNT